VVLDNGIVHYFEYGKVWRDHCNKEQSVFLTIRGHKIQSITSGLYHSIMVTMRGAVFGFGCNDHHQLGVVDPSALLDDTVSTPTKVFTGVTKSKGAT
jgi:alpha-tubulin suppressor-like RCC1 family protein